MFKEILKEAKKTTKKEKLITYYVVVQQMSYPKSNPFVKLKKNSERSNGEYFKDLKKIIETAATDKGEFGKLSRKKLKDFLYKNKSDALNYATEKNDEFLGIPRYDVRAIKVPESLSKYIK